ncbi:MAG: CARDB domain-containing protein [Candidatus Anstonellales archaeon]
MRKELVIFQVVLLSCLVLIQTVFSDLSLVSYTVSPDPVLAGSNGVLVIDLQNTGTLTASVIVDTSTVRPIIGDNKYPVGDLEPSGAIKLAMPFRVEPNASTGIYTMRLTIYGSTKTASQQTSSAQLKTVSLPIKVLNKPLISIEADKITVNKDSENMIKAKLTNRGGRAINVKIYLNSSDFILQSGNPIVVGDLIGEQDLNFSIFVRDTANSGTTAMPLIAVYQDPLGNNYTDVISLPLEIKDKKTSFSVSSKTNTLTVGMQNTISLRLTNFGDSKAYKVKVEIMPTSDITPVGVTSIDVGDIEAGKSVDVPFVLAVSQVEEGYRNLAIKITYEDKNRNKQSESASIGLKLAGRIDLSVNLDTKPTPLTQGKEHTLSVIVSNSGNSKIRGLEVTLESDDNLLVLDSAQTQYIGSLNEDDFSSVQYRVVPKPLASNANIKVKLKYQDVFNNVIEQYKEFNLKIYPQDYLNSLVGNNKNGNQFIILISAIVVLAILIWYFKLRKRK